MTIIDKIDSFLSKPDKKKVIKENFEESGLLVDILNFVESLDDDYLDDNQIFLKEKILSSNFTVIEETPDEVVPDEDIPVEFDDDLDVPVEEPQFDEMDPMVDIPDEFVELTDNDFVEESKKLKKKKATKKLAKK